MKYLKRYDKYKESLSIDLQLITTDILESMNIWYDTLLSSISAEELDVFDTLKLPTSNKLNLDYLSNNIEFINSLSSLGLKKSNLQNTEDYQTFISKPFKFLLLYKIESNELENPVYILFQVWNETSKSWENTKLYKINDDINKFYTKLSSKTIEIIDGDQNYIYNSSNGANEWVLQNSEKENDIYQKVFRKDELEKIIADRKVKVNII